MEKASAPPTRFFKMAGSGNDFILIDNRSGQFDADRSRGLVKSACRRKFSVGADGLIFIENDPEVDFKWRFFNADGSEAEMCGNGARCAARFAHLNGIVSGTRMAFRTLAGIIRAEMRDNRVKVQMTTPHSLALDFCLDVEGRPFSMHFINSGVPHAVTFVDDKAALEATDIFKVGRLLRYHSHFQPTGTNVNFVLVRDAHRMAIRTYERGVEDETLACGTGSIASALVAAARGLVKSPVEMQTRSGECLTIYFDAKSGSAGVEFSEVFLEGDAKVVYEGQLWNETLEQ
ncbi:MAG: diaminopimelate epimerase [Syntrophobacteraceae bacterium]